MTKEGTRFTAGATAARHAASGSASSSSVSRRASKPRELASGTNTVGLKNTGVRLTLASTHVRLGSGGATISPDASLRASGSRTRASPNSYAAMARRASRRDVCSEEVGSAFRASASRNSASSAVTRGGARANDTNGKAFRAREPAATRHLSADRSSGTSSAVCTLSRRFATRISAGRERGAKGGAEAAEGRVAANAAAASYAPGPGDRVRPFSSAPFSSSPGFSSAPFSSRVAFRRRARSASRRETARRPRFPAASGRNATRGARLRESASEGIAGEEKSVRNARGRERLGEEKAFEVERPSAALPGRLPDCFLLTKSAGGGDHAKGPATRGRVGSRAGSLGARSGESVCPYVVVAEARRRSALATPIPSHHDAESPLKESSAPRRAPASDRFEPRGTAGFGLAHLMTPRAPLGRGRVRSIATPRSPGGTPGDRRRAFARFLRSETSSRTRTFFAATAPKGAIHQASASDSSEDDSSFVPAARAGFRFLKTLGFFHCAVRGAVRGSRRGARSLFENRFRARASGRRPETSVAESKGDVRAALANADDGARRRRLEKCSAFSGLAYAPRARAPSSS